MNDHLTLFELNELIKQTLDKNLNPSYWVIAEIGELRTNQKGHCYLELVEKQDERVIAKSRATIWSYTYRNLATWFEGMTGQPLQSGLKILCNVVVQYHELYGLSFNIKDIDATFTIGERARKRKEIIDQLHADGVFDMNRSLDLPLVPQRIAIISSPSAAGYGDFINQLENNSSRYHFKLELYTALMQGDGAPDAIIQALHQIHKQVDGFDAVCIIRGGGSQVDLDCFDNYELAAHVAQFPLPIFTGIGHERDETITDLVAHTHLKTPTAVAEFLIEGMRSFDEQLMLQLSQLDQIVSNRLKSESQQLDSLSYNIKYLVKEKIKTGHAQLDHRLEKLQWHSRNFLKAENQKLATIEKHLDLINPLKLLEKGYSLTYYNGQRLIDQKVAIGDEIKTITKKLTIKSTIHQVEKENE